MKLTNFLLAASAATSIVFANPVADPDNDIANTVSVVDPAKVTPSTSPATPELANPLYDDICYKCAEEKDSCMKGFWCRYVRDCQRECMIHACVTVGPVCAEKCHYLC